MFEAPKLRLNRQNTLFASQFVYASNILREDTIQKYKQESANILHTHIFHKIYSIRKMCSADYRPINMDGLWYYT